MGIFENVKMSLSLSEVAEHYGLKVQRNGFFCCPFHNDRHPSMKLYKDHYHCFTCGAHGDVISLTAQILGLSQYEAAQKLAADFGITLDSKSIAKRSKYISVYEAKKILKEYISILENTRDKYCPASPDEEWHPLFADSVRWLSLYQYYYDLLVFGNHEEQKQFIQQEKRLFNGLRTKLRKSGMAV